MDIALEWQRLERLRCSGCGYPRDETMDPESPGYTAEPMRCKACEARELASTKFLDAEGSSSAGLQFVTTRREADG